MPICLGALVCPSLLAMSFGAACSVLLAACGLLAALGLAACLWRRNSQDAEFRRQLEGVVQAISSGTPNPAQGLSSMPAGNRWRRLATELAEALEQQAGQLAALQQAHTASEVRNSNTLLELDRLRGVFSQMSDPLLVLDDFEDVVLTNRSADELFKRDHAEPGQRALARLIQSEKLLSLALSTARRKTSGSRSEEVELPTPTGSSRWYRATATRIQNDDAATNRARSGTLLALRDIGDQKALQKRNAEFVSSVSHEMKTPLAGIKAYVELLADGEAEDQATREEFLAVIDGQANRLQRLVENLLNIARIEAGVVSVNKHPRSLNEILEEAIRVVGPSAESKQITLTAELSSMYLGVLADRDMLLQAAINLLSNAIKYTHPGGRVTLRSRLVADQVQFEVADTGVGLAPEDCQRVFEKFYRVKKDKDMAAGTGLGLPLAKHIVEDVHGGVLSLESALGVGSTFIVTLPTAQGVGSR